MFPFTSFRCFTPKFFMNYFDTLLVKKAPWDKVWTLFCDFRVVFSFNSSSKLTLELKFLCFMNCDWLLWLLWSEVILLWVFPELTCNSDWKYSACYFSSSVFLNYSLSWFSSCLTFFSSKLRYFFVYSLLENIVMHSLARFFISFFS